MIASHVFVLGHVLFIVISDHYLKWIEAILSETQTSISNQFKDFADKNCIVLATSSPCYLASNGLAESDVKMVKTLEKV